jgi:hypothetical protein
MMSLIVHTACPRIDIYMQGEILTKTLIDNQYKCVKFPCMAIWNNVTLSYIKNIITQYHWWEKSRIYTKVT